jgi:guanylate kinase
MNKQLLVVISGPSGTGKGTVCEKLLEDETIFLSVSATSREQRVGETAGVTYHYHSAEQFEKLISSGKMLEWAKYNGNYYGTPKDKVLEMMEAGRDVLLEIDVQGALQVKKAFSDAVLIFILPPSAAELRRRLTERGRENAEQIEERIGAAYKEICVAEEYDYVIVNDNLDECVTSVLEVMRAEKRRVCRNTDKLDALKQELEKE